MSSSYRSDVMPTKLPAPSSSSVLTARTRSRPPSAVAASLTTCCSGVCAAAGTSSVHATAAIAPRTTCRVPLAVSILIPHLQKTMPALLRGSARGGLECCQHPPRGQRKLTKSHAGRIEERVPDGGHDGRQHFLAG